MHDKLLLQRSPVRKSKTNTRKIGIAALEFLFVAPAFFVLVFFVIEIALIWNDRHVMRLAAYRAARSVVKTRAMQTNTPQLCWTKPTAGAPIDPQNQAVQTRARRAATKVMATVTPTITQLFNTLKVGVTAAGIPVGNPFDQLISEHTEEFFGSVTDTAMSNSYVHAIVRMMKGWPGAWIYTELHCKDIDFPATADTSQTKGVELTLVYNRPAKMPFIGNLMYTLKKMQEFAVWTGVADDGTSGVLRFDPLNYGLVADIDLNNPQMAGAALRIKDIVRDEANKLGQNLADKITEKRLDMPPAGTVALGQLPQIFGAAAGEGFEALYSELKTWNPQPLNWIADQALSLYLMVPDEVKTIPVTVSVRIPNYSQVYVNRGQEWNNGVVGIGSLTGNNNMGKMAKEIGSLIDSDEPPFDPATKTNKLPYIP
ncbi:MAG: pilus assembly protein [Proteobacteria bacterium]|nr:pilus assembly protein [Pseudomonadota bacterium]